MSKKLGRPLITRKFVEAAKKRVVEVGRLESQKQMKQREPHLYGALCEIANGALADRPENLSDETQTVIHDALWRGVMVAVEAYRVAQYHLWADTCLGPQMDRLDPGLAKRAFDFPDRSGEARLSDDGESRNSRDQDDDGGNDR